MRKWLARILFSGKYKRLPVLLLVDFLCFFTMAAAYFLIAFNVKKYWGLSIRISFLAEAALHLALIYLFRFGLKLYRNVWRYSNTRSFFMLMVSDTLAGFGAAVFAVFLPAGALVGILQAAVLGSSTLLVTLASRFIYSLLYKYSANNRANHHEKLPVVIVGAGRLGSYLAGDLAHNVNSRYSPAFFVDTDISKINHDVHGIPVYSPEEAERRIRKEDITTVIIAVTSKSGELLSELYSHYSELGCKVKIYETLGDGVKGAAGVLREFSVEDLLFREPLNLMEGETASVYAGKTVLVTGGGGSIGSEICRQIAKCGVGRLVIFDIYENNAYDIQQELIRQYGASLKLSVEIGSVRDADKLDEIFAFYRPDFVFHAAAHKHVPLMEHSASEAIKNNVLGTYHAANAAEKYGTKKFILISTDKAVNPTNIMGASKRVCEMVIQCRTDSKTCFAAVRFGNVLGSNGSVIPLFRKQIAAGGPVTVTDKRIIRYFMTIPEASQLVIQAGAMAKSGDLFVLDMGNPVKIYDLAVNIIRLSGLTPGKDIMIREIGLRPGEKLYEELLMKSESLEKTENNLIFIERDTPYSRREVDEKIRVLTEAVSAHTSIKEAIAAVVPTYHDPVEINSRAETSAEMRATVSCEKTVVPAGAKELGI